MHIFGGVLIPEERITNEHWALHLPTLTWSPLTLNTHDDDDDNYVITEPDNSTDIDLNAVDVSMEIINANSASGPIRARGHTAHVIGSTMVVLFGMTDSQHTFIYYVQEYDFGKCNAVCTELLWQCCVVPSLLWQCCVVPSLLWQCCVVPSLLWQCCVYRVVVAVFEVCCVLFQSRVSGQSPVRTDWSHEADWDTRQCMMSRLDWCMCMVAISLMKCPRSCWSMTQWLTSGREGAGESTFHTLTVTFTPSLPPSLSPSLSLPPPFLSPSGPAAVYLHSSVLIWDSLMLVFGGSWSERECFSDQLLVYSTGICTYMYMSPSACVVYVHIYVYIAVYARTCTCTCPPVHVWYMYIYMYMYI